MAVLGTTVLTLLSGACSLDGLLNSDKLPSDVSDPVITRTASGAVAAYNGTLAKFREAFGSYSLTGGDGDAFVVTAGTLSDELSAIIPGTAIDSRNIGKSPSNPYDLLQKVRGQAQQAIGLLTDYLPDKDLIGHLYAIQGYAEVFLAELYCSGIPLSTLDYHGDFTYSRGLTTTQVTNHAIALFDTALELEGDSAWLAPLAQVGKARALLALGDFTAAGTVVTSVTDDYYYDVEFSAREPLASGGDVFEWANFGAIISSVGYWFVTVPDREGSNGLDWQTSGDPRVPLTAFVGEHPFVHPDNYARDGSSPIVLASGIEARLIGAEAALQAGGDWLTKLNALRTDGTYDTRPDASDPSKTDTLWHAGTGRVAGLKPLEDPGTPNARIDLLFRERAFWLFLTGHRQGDLRRLLRRPYARSQSMVYPVGAYPYGQLYGTTVAVPIPASENANPLFTGCASTGA